MAVYLELESFKETNTLLKEIASLQIELDRVKDQLDHKVHQLGKLLEQDYLSVKQSEQSAKQENTLNSSVAPSKSSVVDVQEEDSVITFKPSKTSHEADLDGLMEEDRDTIDFLEEKEKLSLEVEQMIVDDYMNGIKDIDIQESWGISSGRLRTILNKHNVPLRNKSKVQERILNMTDRRIDTIISQYQEGDTTKHIMEEHDINKNTLYNILDMFDVPRRG